MKILKTREGFTLIEILIVVAIIAILASVVLVGLGPTQEAGRDARRISDLHEVQTGLELYYSQNGSYPTATSWTDLASTLTGAGIGVSEVPNDPSNGQTYQYCATTDGSTYLLGAQLETNNSAFIGYQVPSVFGGGNGQCMFQGSGSGYNCTATSKQYCLTL